MENGNILVGNVSIPNDINISVYFIYSAYIKNVTSFFELAISDKVSYNNMQTNSNSENSLSNQLLF